MRVRTRLAAAIHQHRRVLVGRAAPDLAADARVGEEQDGEWQHEHGARVPATGHSACVTHAEVVVAPPQIEIISKFRLHSVVNSYKEIALYVVL